MNTNFILEQVDLYLNDNNEISQEELDELFPGLISEEFEEIKTILNLHNISIVQEKDDNLRNYKQNIKRHPKEYINILRKLSNEKLCIMHQQGDISATEALISKNQLFIKKVANVMFKKYRQHSYDIDDFINEGVIGLLYAANKFDSLKGYKFLTYAWHWIKQSMERAVINNAFDIRLPAHVFEKLRKIYFCRKKHPDAKLDELEKYLAFEKKLHLTKNDLIKWIQTSEFILETVSLNEIISEDGNSTSEIIDFVSGNIPSAEKIAIQNIEKQQIDDILNISLKKKEFEVLGKRFGLNSNYTMTLDEIGKTFNVTRERIRQIECKALQKLKKYRSKDLLDYYND